MHIPVGTPVTLHVTSADVIHSFWVPEVRLKYDMVPGLVQTLRFTPERIGKYRIICTEFCGTNHGNMVANLYIDSQQDFGHWIAAQFKAQGQGAGPLNLDAGARRCGGATALRRKVLHLPFGRRVRAEDRRPRASAI